MKSSTKNDPKSHRDVAYYQQRYRNRVFAKLISFITDQSQKQHLTKRDIADRIRKDPAQLSRLLSNPSNLTLDTISDLLLAFDAEAEPPEIVLFKDRRAPNYIHPLMARALNVTPAKAPADTQTTSSGQKVFRFPKPTVEVEFNAASSGG